MNKDGSYDKNKSLLMKQKAKVNDIIYQTFLAKNF